MSYRYRTHRTRQVQVAVLGNPVRDAYLATDTINFAAGQVVFRVGTATFDIAHQGQVLRFGEKCYAQHDLSALDLTPFTIHNGGGVYHTATQMAHLCRQRRLPVAFCAIDLITPWSELTAAYARLGIQHLCLGLERPATNLILTNGQPDRLILKSPIAERQLTPVQIQQLRQQLPAHPDLLIVNSLRSVDLARTVMDEARRRGAAQYSVLTPSLALDARIELQLRHDQASVCNLAEFALIADAFGITCPTDEECAALAEVAAAMIALAGHGKSGDLVVTLGRRGSLVADRACGTITHVALQEHYQQQVQAHLQAQPARKNGAGDRFFGSFVLAHAFAKRRCANRAARAAAWAAVEMVRQLAPGLQPDGRWVTLTHLADRNGRGRERKVYCASGWQAPARLARLTPHQTVVA